MTSRSGKRAIKQSLKRQKKRKQKDSATTGKFKRRGKDADVLSIDLREDDLSPRQRLVLERAAAARRRETIAFIAGVLFGCAFVGLLIGLLIEPKLGVAAGGALMCLIMSFKYQRLALYAFIMYIPFAGTVTYALGGNAILQVAKDIFYIPALIGVYQFCKKNRLPIVLPQSLKPPLVILFIVVMANVLVANVPDQITRTGGNWPIVMAIWGVKLLFGYMPLVACIYYLLRKKEDLIGLLRLQSVLVLIACGLGLLQFLALRTGYCPGTTGVGEEMFRASLDARCLVGGSLLYSPEVGQIRLPGTFVAPWQWGWFLISAAFFSFGTTFSDKSVVWRTVGLVSLVAVMIMAVISGQRIALVLVPFMLGVLTVLTGQVANLKRFIPIGIVLGLIVFYLVVNNPEVVQTRVDSLVARWTASPPQAFIAEQFEQVWKEQEGVFGHGVGRATNSARSFARTQLIETYHPKLIYEIGPLGLLAALAVYTTMSVATFKAYRRTKDKNLRSYAASMWVFVLFISFCPYYYPLDVDPVGVYYWLAAGIALKIPELERQEEAKLAASVDLEEDDPKQKKRRRRFKEQPTFD